MMCSSILRIERDYYMIPEKGRFKIFKPAHCVMRFFIFLAHSNPSLALRVWIAGK
jgi:hypothetical protein